MWNACLLRLVYLLFETRSGISSRNLQLVQLVFPKYSTGTRNSVTELMKRLFFFFFLSIIICSFECMVIQDYLKWYIIYILKIFYISS